MLGKFHSDVLLLQDSFYLAGPSLLKSLACTVNQCELVVVSGFIVSISEKSRWAQLKRLFDIRFRLSRSTPNPPQLQHGPPPKMRIALGVPPSRLMAKAMPSVPRKSCSVYLLIGRLRKGPIVWRKFYFARMLTFLSGAEGSIQIFRRC